MHSSILADFLFLVVVFSRLKGTRAECGAGKFGRDCLLDCHCSGRDVCSADGKCSTCSNFWTGPTCQISLYNVAQNKVASQGPDIAESRGDAGNAVDGDNNTNAWVQNKNSPGQVWWVVDLGSVTGFSIIQLEFFRVDASDDRRRAGFSLEVSNSSDGSGDKVCYEHSFGDIPPPMMSFPNCTSPARYIKLYNSRNNSSLDAWSTFANLQISEVEALSDRGCSKGTYGAECAEECGQCVSGECNRIDGSCKDCRDGFYGNGCEQPCPSTCQNNTCLKSGECVRCQQGNFYGLYCNISCNDNCINGCYQGNGTCKACKDKFFGEKCESPCTYCKKSCFRNGTCSAEGCETGYHGNMCNKKCDAACVNGAGCDRETGRCHQCEKNKFGDVCQHSCDSNCVDNTCYRNGTCINGCQDSSFYGDTCDVKCNSTIVDCLECQGTSLTFRCVRCHNGKHGSACEDDCPSNCDECSSETECTQCKPGYSGVKCSDRCEIQNCKLCNMAGSCQTCADGFFGRMCKGKCNADCKVCETDPKDATLSVCNQCMKGKFLYTNSGDCINCSSGCAACERYNNCTECIAGKYGTLCSYLCPQNCKECVSKDECTKCQDGWSGKKCTCSHNCTREGAVDNWCNANGECLKGCVKGKMGNTCDFDCPKKEHCLACEQNDGRCTECVSGLYGRLNHCDKNCGNCQPDSLGKVNCNIENGECIGHCVNGFFGKYCNISCSEGCYDPKTKSQKCDKYTGNCASCKPGFYGLTCGVPCNLNCLDQNTNTNMCDQQTGTCSNCRPGYFGKTCETECSSRCSLLLGTSTCDKDTGKCFSCPDNSFGKYCDEPCPENCETACEQDTGICEACRSHHYGLFCNQTCLPNCGTGLSGKIVCQRETGECLYCKDGVYGQNCQYKCPSNCRRNVLFGKHPHCHKADGSCPRCEDGYHGIFCENDCNKNCGTSEGNNRKGSCNQTTGVCEQGCQSGFYGDICNMTCNSTCKDRACNMKTAECLQGCEYGYDGVFCEKEVGSDYTWIVIVGIVLFLVALVLILGGFLLKRYRNKKKEASNKQAVTNGGLEERNPLIANGNNSMPLKTLQNRRQKEPFDDVDEEDLAAKAIMDKTKPSDYYDPSTRIMVSNFTEYLQGRKRENPDWFKEDFAKLPKGLLKTCNDAMTFSNRGKCRYKQLYPYDENRVKLEPEEDEKSDFINASYVHGYKAPKAFIAAQGPTDITVKDFWRMIFQKDCGKIVMLTNLFEECKMKCVRYWPEADEPQTYGKYEVTLVSENELPNYTIRHLQATHGVTKEVKDFQHLHFTAWPDRGVPDNPSIMLNFRDKVMHESSYLEGPILVHCSAGIGRTGTFVALDYLLRQAHAEAYIDVFNTVIDMRYQRTNFVQTDVQYEFVHNAIVEALNTKECEVTQEQFGKYYWSLLESAYELAEVTKLQEQFRMVNEMAPEFDDECFSAGSSVDNLHKNRYPQILPLDLNRAYLSTPVKGSNDYINAVFIPTCSNKTGFLITQMPLPHTVTDFWRLVYDQHVSNIVMMNNIDDNDETIGEYWPSDDSTYGPFRVQHLSCDSCEDFSVMHIQLTYTSLSRQNKMMVKLFRYEGWPEDQMLPPNTLSLTSLISQVSASSRDSKTEPIIVHCMDGVERSGLYCAVAAVLDRLHMDKKINIPQTILQLRTRRPQLVNSFEQFEFVYRAVLEHLDSTQIYSNVL